MRRGSSGFHKRNLVVHSFVVLHGSLNLCRFQFRRLSLQKLNTYVLLQSFLRGLRRHLENVKDVSVPRDIPSRSSCSRSVKSSFQWLYPSNPRRSTGGGAEISWKRTVIRVEIGGEARSRVAV